jgi:hypothetical protein
MITYSQAEGSFLFHEKKHVVHHAFLSDCINNYLPISNCKIIHVILPQDKMIEDERDFQRTTFTTSIYALIAPSLNVTMIS